MNHVEEVIYYVDLYLEKANLARARILKAVFTFLSHKLLEVLLSHANYVELVEKQVGGQKWVALRSTLEFYKSQTKLRGDIIPVLADDYYSLGRFTYLKHFAELKLHPLYIISANKTDTPVFWPLLLHELAHCLLTETTHLSGAVAYIAEHSPLEERPLKIERRVEELLCDIIATRLCGPAYLNAFIHSLWPCIRVRPSEDYPSNSLRLRCMMLTLQDCGISDYDELVNRIIRSISVFDRLDETDKLINSTMIRLVELTRDIPTLINEKTYRKIKETLTMIKGLNPSEIFNVSWILLNSTPPENFVKKALQLSQLILNQLSQ
ncbi:MAG: hypothetical protein DRP08_01690 [Candidatus Aenigmatarchaeota archaeon]|nr:MAG: hypothetical protein DRP08_01690 [Candidatus Aenigmarchaeota archaeon]